MTSKSQEKKFTDVDENILKLFDIKKRLGKGAYGIVWKALDKRTNETLAVKKIFDAFRDETDAQRTFREICFLQSFRSHPNVVRMLNVYKASNNLDIYLVFEYMESDLHNIIKKGSILKDVHKRYVMYQLVNAIRYIHSGNVIHRDLKPSNVLIDSKCRAKLADFGLARSLSNQPSGNAAEMGVLPLLTDYVATRWYRAPEILVASKRYTKGIDMWSLGCILAEMIRGKPLFQGTSTINQIEKIISALPEITEHDIRAVGASFGSVLLSKQASSEKRTSLNELLPDTSDDALDMVKSLLVLDPLARLNAAQALEHPYVERFRESMPELELDKNILPPFRDDVRLTVGEYRTKLYEMAQTATDERLTLNGHHRRHTSKRAGPSAPIAKSRERNVQDQSDSQRKLLTKPSTSSGGCVSIGTTYLETTPQPPTIKSTQVRKPMKQPIISPRLRTKLMETSKTPNRNRTIIDPRHGSTQYNQTTMETKPNHSIISKSKTPSKSDHYLVDKRHSIDGGYGSLPVEAGSSQKTPTLQQSTKVYKTSPITKLNVNNPSNGVMQDKSKPPTPTLREHRSLRRSTSVIVNNVRPRQLHADVAAEAPKSKIINREPSDLCYDVRIKKLEANIAGIKDDIKQFAKENKYFARPPTPTRDTALLYTQLQQPSRHSQMRSKYTTGSNVVAQTLTTSKTSTSSFHHLVPAEGNVLTTTKRTTLAFPTLPRDKTEREPLSIYKNTGGSGDHIPRNYASIETAKSNDLYKCSTKHRQHLPHHQQSRTRVSSKVI